MGEMELKLELIGSHANNTVRKKVRSVVLVFQSRPGLAGNNMNYLKRSEWRSAERQAEASVEALGRC